jgi:hypothetical protein
VTVASIADYHRCAKWLSGRVPTALKAFAHGLSKVSGPAVPFHRSGSVEALNEGFIHRDVDPDGPCPAFRPAPSRW